MRKSTVLVTGIAIGVMIARRGVQGTRAVEPRAKLNSLTSSRLRPRVGYEKLVAAMDLSAIRFKELVPPMAKVLQKI